MVNSKTVNLNTVNSNTVNLNTVNSNMVNSKMVYSNTVNSNTVNSYFYLFRRKSLATKDFELTVPDLYHALCMLGKTSKS